MKEREGEGGIHSLDTQVVSQSLESIQTCLKDKLILPFEPETMKFYQLFSSKQLTALIENPFHADSSGKHILLKKQHCYQVQKSNNLNMFNKMSQTWN